MSLLPNQPIQGPLQGAFGGMMSNPMLQYGLGILAANQPGASFGQAVGRGLLGAQQNMYAMQQQQLQQALLKAKMEEAEREREKEKRVREARANIAQQYPKFGPLMEAYPSAAPQMLGAIMKGPGDAPSSVREWQYYSSLPQEQQEQYLNMKRANQWLNLGGQYVMPSPVSPGQAAAAMPITPPPEAMPEFKGAQAAASAAGAERGKREAGAELDFPKIQSQTEYAIKLLDDIESHPGLEGSVGMKGWQFAFGARESPAFGTSEADFMTRLDQLKGKQFLEAFESLKGGGHITEIEGKKATEAAARMNTAQTEKEFKRSVREYKDILIKGLMRKAKKQGVDWKYNKPSTTGGWSIKRKD